MIRHNEIWNASLKYADEHPSDYTNEMYDIGDIEKAFEAGAEWADEHPGDAFINKVVNFLEILGYAYTITDNITKSLYDNTQLIEDFKKYMEE